MSGQQALNVRGKGKGIPEDKVVLVGSQGVGKTTIFKRFTTGRFVEEEDLSHHSQSECCMQWDLSERGGRASVSKVFGLITYIIQRGRKRGGGGNCPLASNDNFLSSTMPLHTSVYRTNGNI